MTKETDSFINPKYKSISVTMAIIAVLILLGVNDSFALDCNKPPPAWGSNWDNYADWCVQCGGTPNVNTTTCTPGENWGRKDSGAIRQDTTVDEIKTYYEREEQLRRQREAEAKRRKLETEKARRREEARKKQFEEDKKDALNMLKSGADQLSLKGGSSSNDLQLKGTGQTDLKLKEPLFSKGHKGSAPPYLAGLDSKWPIVVDLKKVQGGTPEALFVANRSTHVLLDALEANPKDWEGSIRYLKNRLEDNPDDLAVRDALNLIRGYYKGYLGAKKLGDDYYKYGVREALSGYFDAAANAFAFAYENNPDDKRLLCSFAYALGRRNKSCEYRYFIDIHTETFNIATGKTSDIQKQIEQTKAILKTDPGNHKLRSTMNYLEGLAGYRSYQDTILGGMKGFNETYLKRIETGLMKLGKKNYIAGWKEIAIGLRGGDKQAALFAINYAEGLNGRDDLYELFSSSKEMTYVDALVLPGDDDLNLLFPPHSNDVKYVDALVLPTDEDLDVLFSSLKNTDNQNPFFGVLDDKQIKEMKKKVSLFFK